MKKQESHDFRRGSITQLTDAKKQQLKAKIEEARERRASNESEQPSGIRRNRVTFSFLWKYGMLAIILLLLAYGVMHLLKRQNFAYDEYGDLIVGLMLLFNHIACNFTKTGWKSRVMKTVAGVWLILVFVYIFWVA